MKIDGIDPLLLNKVKEKPDLKEIQKPESSATYTRVSRDRSSVQSDETDRKDTRYDEKVEKAISKLNDNAEKNGSTLRFRAKKDSKLWQVEVVDIRNKEVVHEIPTERALEVANRIQGLYGILMDEKR